MIIGVTGGKGGTGKTVVAVNLAIAIAKEGKSIAYLDCDVDCPSSHLIAGAERRSKQDVHSFVPQINNDKCVSCGACVQKCEFNALYQLKGKPPTLVSPLCSGCGTCKLVCPSKAIEESSKVIGWTYEASKYGVDFYSGELKPSEPLSEKIVDAVKSRGLAREHDVIIVDTAAGAHCQVVCALEGCEKAIAVTEPTFFGEHDLKVISKVLEKLEIPYDTIVNRSDISQREIKSSLRIPYERKMLDCYIEGVPIIEKYPEHQISKDLTEYAKRLIN